VLKEDFYYLVSGSSGAEVFPGWKKVLPQNGNYFQKMDIDRICHQLVTQKWTFRAFVTNLVTKQWTFRGFVTNLVTQKWTFRGFVTNLVTQKMDLFNFGPQKVRNCAQKMDFFNFGPQKVRHWRTKNGLL
jgi:hypothetical protein